MQLDVFFKPMRWSLGNSGLGHSFLELETNFFYVCMYVFIYLLPLSKKQE